EAAQVIERAIDAFAAEIGLDPAEVRRRNFIGRDDFPFTTAVGTKDDTGDYARALDLALEAADYAGPPTGQQRRREAGDPRVLGIGLSVYVEITNGFAEPEFGAVEITSEGTAILRTGSFQHGQGHETSYAMIVADRLGLPIESVQVVFGDTDVVGHGGGGEGAQALPGGGRPGRAGAAAEGGRPGGDGGRRPSATTCRGGARGESGRRRARPERGRVPRRRRPVAVVDVGGAGGPPRRARPSRRAPGGAGLQAAERDVPVRSAPPRRP